MLPTETELCAELISLRKGLGLRRPALLDRVGPGLRQVCRLDDAVGHGEARSVLVAVLRSACDSLPVDAGMLASAMLGLDPGFPDPTLTGRQSRLAAVLGVDPVTVRRRCDLALGLLAAQLMSGDSGTPAPDDPFRRNDWYTAESIAVMRLDTTTPEVTSRLTVVAMCDRLEGVQLSQGLGWPRDQPRPASDVTVDVQFGGVLESSRRLSAEYFAYRIRFPEPLARGERHTFGMTTRLPRDRHQPHLVSWARRRVDRFELRIRFDLTRLPRAVWCLNGVPYRVSEADGPTREVLRPDRVGEVAVEFERLVLGLGYGVAWLP
jgi:hypothetical protein